MAFSHSVCCLYVYLFVSFRFVSFGFHKSESAMFDDSVAFNFFFWYTAISVFSNTILIFLNIFAMNYCYFWLQIFRDSIYATVFISNLVNAAQLIVFMGNLDSTTLRLPIYYLRLEARPFSSLSHSKYSVHLC